MAALAKQIFRDYDLNSNRLINAGFEQRATAPATPFVGQLYEDTSVNPSTLRRWNGTTWITLDNAPQGGFQPQGGIDASGNPAFPGSPVEGYVWLITVAGTVGGVEVEVGDQLYYLNGGFTVLQTNLVASTETQAGFVRIATQAETDTGTNDLTAVSPLKLQVKLQPYARKYTATITGDSTTTDFVVNHALGSLAVVVQVDGVTSGRVVDTDIEKTDTANVTISFVVPPANGVQYRVTVIG